MNGKKLGDKRSDSFSLPRDRRTHTYSTGAKPTALLFSEGKRWKREIESKKKVSVKQASDLISKHYTFKEKGAGSDAACSRSTSTVCINISPSVVWFFKRRHPTKQLPCHQPRPKKGEEMKKCLNIATPWDGGREGRGGAAVVWLKWITFVQSQLLMVHLNVLSVAEPKLYSTCLQSVNIIIHQQGLSSAVTNMLKL